MFKIKLSILLLVSLFFFSCTNNQVKLPSQKYSLAYIGGGFDGLLLKNYLVSNLKNLDMYDSNSDFEIRTNIAHNTNLFITNIDNTSDRERINTKVSFQIMNTIANCQILNDEISVSQFYVYASSDKFLSNQIAAREIKKNNTDTIVRQFINKLKNISDKCDD
jgi:hypothetical protein